MLSHYKCSIEQLIAIPVFLVISVLIITSLSSGSQLTAPYHSSSWYMELPRTGYVGDAMPDSGFFGYSVSSGGETKFGYPYHYGLVKGVNDSFMVVLDLATWKTGPISLSGYTPENWVMPVIYDNYISITNNNLKADTTDFGYRFEYWALIGRGHKVPRPTELKIGNSYAMYFLVWDVPSGLNVIDMVPTVNKPPVFEVKHFSGYIGQYFYTEAQDVRDTINAYLTIAVRQRDRVSWTPAYSWIDSAFALNDSSLATWRTKSYIAESQGDTALANVCYLKIKSIYENNHDPLCDLSGQNTTEIEKKWAKQIYDVSLLSKALHDKEVQTGKLIIMP